MLSGSILIPVPSQTWQNYVTCPNCNAQVTANSNFCNFCGTSLKPKPIVMKICPNCKNRIAESAKYCPECGQKQ